MNAAALEAVGAAACALPRPLPIVGASALGPWPGRWQDLGDALLDGLRPAQPQALLPEDAQAPAMRRLRSRMAPSALMAALALEQLLQTLGLTPEQRLQLGYYLGVGASGGDVEQLHAMLRPCMIDGRFDLGAFGQAGLAACSPLYAFQLMNNFTMCHGAILSGVGGPNAALYSRGAGTAWALAQAAWAVLEGDCALAVAGGADSALHPVTRAELRRGWPLRERPDALTLTEGVALLALGQADSPPLAWLSAAGSLSAAQVEQLDLAHQPETLRFDARQGDLQLGQRALYPDGSPPLALAAQPAWLWLAALRLLRRRPELTHLTVLTRGLEEAWGVARFERARPQACDAGGHA